MGYLRNEKKQEKFYTIQLLSSISFSNHAQKQRVIQIKNKFISQSNINTFLSERVKNFIFS